MTQHALRIVVMGVSGCGKSTVGLALAQRLGLPFIEGDALHPPSNIRKMSDGIALTDEDRLPWLDSVAAALANASGGAIASCSALKKSYRDRLRTGVAQPLGFLYLEGSVEVLSQRMASRTRHFMPASMLQSQLATLEPPCHKPSVLRQDIQTPLEEIVEAAAAYFR